MDVQVVDHGSVVILRALTAAAKGWFDAHLPADALPWGRDGVVVEPRYVSDIVEGMVADGLEVGP